MRLIERIDPFLEKVKLRYLLKYVWKTHNRNASTIAEKIKLNSEKIKEFWKWNPDLRFSQVLISLGFVPNSPGIWYYMEEHDILLEMGYPLEETLFWGQNFDKDMNRLPETIWKPIKELTTDHLNAIIDGGYVETNPLYKQIMLGELERREERGD